MRIVILILIIKILDGVRTHGSYTEKKDADGYFGFLTLRLDRLHFLLTNQEDNFTYVISNPNIAGIKNGILLPKKEGLTEITFYDEHQNKHKTVIVNILPKSTDSFDQIRLKWRDMLLGESYYNPADSLMSNVQNRTDTEVLALWEAMNKEEDRENIWNKTQNYFSLTKHMTSEFKSLYKLAAAVMNKHSRHYLKRDLLSDTISGLEWMRMNKYNAKLKTYVDWKDWEIESPSHILNSLIMLYPILSDDEISSYLTAIDRSVPDTNDYRRNMHLSNKAKGSNLVSLSKIKILQNSLRREEKGLNDAKEALEKIFRFATLWEVGFYADGSFLQHIQPSTGSYGFTVLCGVSEILSMIQSTKYALVGEKIDKVFTWISEAFAPLIYNGMFMDMVRGKAISRQFDDSTDTAKLFEAIMNIAELSTKMQVVVYKKMVKQWITKDFVNSLTSYRDIFLAKQILNDSSIGTDGILGTLFKNYAKMDRVVYRNAEKDFALGISMNSQRLTRYVVAVSGENKHGWFTADGMVYLYNGDLLQFRDNFWATVDPYRLPGITVEKENLIKSTIDMNRKAFVGGSILDNQTGMVAMDFNYYSSFISGRKSWSVFHSKIIALGSGITNNNTNVIETIFENRKLDKAIQYKLYINDCEVDISVPFENRVEKVNSIYLQSKDINQCIGYKLLTPQKLTIKVENRQGAWSSINDRGSSKLITRKYLTIWKTHSKEIDDYNYAIYPSISRKEFKELKPITLLKNTEDIHAVADNEGNLGVTIFKEGNYSIGDLTMSQPMILVKKDFNNNVKIAIADPAMELLTSYNVTLWDKSYEIAAKDKNVKTVLKNGVWSISVDPSNKLGQSSTITFTKKKNRVYK